VRHIKLVIISFVVLFIIVTLISLLIPSQIRISKALAIHATKEQVLEQIGDPSKWKNWYPGADTLEHATADGKLIGVYIKKGSAQALVLTGKTDSTVNAENMGPGTKDISMTWSVYPGDREGIVTVQWYMDFKLRWYPWEKFSSLLFEKQYGIQMERGLNKLKMFLETNMTNGQ
jgi:hypothetical protein